MLDENRKEIKPCFCYRDSRTTAVVDEVESLVSSTELYAKTGIQKQNFKTIYQLYADKKSGRLLNAKYFLMMPEYLSFKLTGVCKNEYTNATTTGLVNANAKTWDTDIIYALGLTEVLLPPLSLPSSLVGELSDDANVIIELLQVFLEDDYFKDTLGVCSNMMPQLVEKISPTGMLVLSDENATYEDFAKANGVCEDADEIELTMLMSEKISPELVDARADIMNLIDDKDNQINTKLVDLFFVGCLCTDYKNRLMWSHYADSHKGFCVEYDYSSLTEAEMLSLPLPIIYAKGRPLLPWKAALDNTLENISEATAQITLGLLTKDDEWKYENEWRILVSSIGSTEFEMPKISCIYLGAAISDKNKAKILEIAKRKNILVVVSSSAVSPLFVTRFLFIIPPFCGVT